MPQLIADSHRVEDSTNRIRSAIRSVPLAIVPLTTSICVIPASAIGNAGLAIGALFGVVSGFYLSGIMAAALEALMIVMVQLDHISNQETSKKLET